jgi:hypothetical protein
VTLVVSSVQRWTHEEDFVWAIDVASASSESGVHVWIYSALWRWSGVSCENALVRVLYFVEQE